MTKKVFNAQALEYGEEVVDLSGMRGKFVGYSSMTAVPNQRAIIELEDGTVVFRNVALIREHQPEEVHTIEVSLSTSELTAIANYPLGSVCNPLVIAARTALKGIK
jgi:hypothetical protein